MKLKGLCKSFEEKEVLTDINATFENGKTNLIIGQSGSGKTVLMKCIVGLLDPGKGRVIIRPPQLSSPWERKRRKTLRREMGMIFQSAALFDSMYCAGQRNVPAQHVQFDDTVRDRTRRAMFCSGPCEPHQKPKINIPGEISGGMQKRVAIARAIALNPQYLFCDEPNSGLDPKTSSRHRRTHTGYHPRMTT